MPTELPLELRHAAAAAARATLVERMLEKEAAHLRMPVAELRQWTISELCSCKDAAPPPEDK